MQRLLCINPEMGVAAVPRVASIATHWGPYHCAGYGRWSTEAKLFVLIDDESLAN